MLTTHGRMRYLIGLHNPAGFWGKYFMVASALKNNGNCSGKGATPEIEQERIRKIKEKAILNNGGYRKGSRQRKERLV